MSTIDFKWYTWTSVLLALVALAFSFRSFNQPFHNPLAADLASLGAMENPLDLVDLDDDPFMEPLPPLDSPLLPSSSTTNVYMQRFSHYLQNEKFCVLVGITSSLGMKSNWRSIVLTAACSFWERPHSRWFSLIFGSSNVRFKVTQSFRIQFVQHMYDRLLNFLLFKVVFIGAVLEPTWTQLLILATWFAVLGYLRIFSMLCRDRFEYLSVTSGVSTQTHLKIVSLLGIIIVCDFAWYIACVQVFGSMLLFLTFECLTLLLDTTQTLIKYIIHLGDIWANNMWESRGHLLYYTEFLSDTLILVATLAHYVHIMIIHGISFSLIDLVLFLNMRSVLNNLRKKFISHRNHWQAMSNVRDSYKNATDADLHAYNDNCAICREPMANAKKLPCGHLFHLSVNSQLLRSVRVSTKQARLQQFILSYRVCLRSWVEYHTSNSTCPTCRRSLCEPKEENEPPSSPVSSGTTPVVDLSRSSLFSRVAMLAGRRLSLRVRIEFNALEEGMGRGGLKDGWVGRWIEGNYASRGHGWDEFGWELRESSSSAPLTSSLDALRHWDRGEFAPWIPTISEFFSIPHITPPPFLTNPAFGVNRDAYHDEGTKDRPYGYAVVAGIERYPLKVTRDMGQKRVARRSKVKPFIKLVNYNHLMPTRYILELEIKGVVSNDSFKEPSQRNVAKKVI
ncbi:hypothetical protein BC936DRAFT_147373 [Jimgerdemannia flammicorona]|uniref:RING-type domain-containing protein n=1 Tax=Jimgerdemannia flammicorona TaxID=994334 RepID=A0A433D5G9_9FUNG|nr:hypothetical protein BC936DRAFT_147373 [Jimgerdemannia flammicorona]